MRTPSKTRQKSSSANRSKARWLTIATILGAASALALETTASFDWHLPPGFHAPPVPADNPISAAKVELGRYLFYDLRLSVNGEGSCSTCHMQQFGFTDQRPVSYWQRIQASEYGFWANVNPEVPHPRWSQAMERVLGTNERRPTLLYNGYGEFVAPLYAGLQGERLFM